MDTIHYLILNPKNPDMKTFLHLKKIKFILILSVSLFFQQAISAQSLSFISPVLEKGDALQIGATYRFSDVLLNVDALLTIEDLINGAEVRQIDNAEGQGFGAAFQPLVYSPGGTGTSYALFSVAFVLKGTNSPVTIANFAATSVDLDGNSNLKEFSEVTIPGSSSLVKYTTTSSQITVSPVINGYAGTNISGAEVTGIDTSNVLAMYTVQSTSVGGFNFKMGAVTVAAPAENRQHSFYLNDFNYNNIGTGLFTLPVKMYSFTANLNNNKVDLKWITASEINVSHFIVEKSTDGINFSDAGMVFANGNATDKTNYSLSDNVNTSQAVYFITDFVQWILMVRVSILKPVSSGLASKQKRIFQYLLILTR